MKYDYTSWPLAWLLESSLAGDKHALREMEDNRHFSLEAYYFAGLPELPLWLYGTEDLRNDIHLLHEDGIADDLVDAIIKELQRRGEWE